MNISTIKEVIYLLVILSLLCSNIFWILKWIFPEETFSSRREDELLDNIEDKALTIFLYKEKYGELNKNKEVDNENNKEKSQ